MDSRLRPADSDGGARPRYRTPPTPKSPQTIRTPHAAARLRRAGITHATRLWRATRTGTMCSAGSAAFTRTRATCMYACMYACIQGDTSSRCIRLLMPIICVQDTSTFSMLLSFASWMFFTNVAATPMPLSALSNDMSDEHIMCMQDTCQRVPHMLCTSNTC